MKTIYKSLIAVALIGLSMLGILMLQKKSHKLKIGIIQIVEHEALDNARNGFIDEMKNLGYDADFDVQIAGGDISNLFKLLAGEIDLLILKGDTAVVQVHAKIAHLYDIVGRRLRLPHA